ncbi:UNVERIFIED_CONTAM: hypothetical protein K2H54_001420 [Gekko kuhli]
MPQVGAKGLRKEREMPTGTAGMPQGDRQRGRESEAKAYLRSLPNPIPAGGSNRGDNNVYRLYSSSSNSVAVARASGGGGAQLRMRPEDCRRGCLCPDGTRPVRSQAEARGTVVKMKN